MKYIYDDGGRKEAGYKGNRAGDCVCRAVAIASGIPYKEVYKKLAEGMAMSCGIKSARNGVTTRAKWFKDYMRSIGFEWVATMQYGKGCKVHLKSDELPKGNIICRVTRHYVAVIDGVIHDTYNPSRDGTRCVYGYWRKVA